jgi:hypothetical protein
MLQARLVFAALLAMLAPLVLVGGCSSEVDAPVQTGPASSPTGTSSVSAPTTRPSVDEFAFPADVKLVFETPLTGDEVQDAVLEAWMNLEKSWVKATLSKGYRDRTYQKYADVPVRLTIGDYLERKKDSNSSVIGTRKFFDADVEDPSNNIAMVRACQDDTLFYGRDLKTGRALLTTPSQRDFNKLAVGMVLREGKWIAASYGVEEGAEACVR